MAKTGVTIEVSGPLFGPNANKILVAGVTAGIQDLTEQGEDRLNTMASIRPIGFFLTIAQAGREKVSIGDYRRGISSKVSRLKAIITDGGVIYGPWLEGTSSRNDTTRFKGYGMFRKVRDWLQARAKRVMEPHIRRAVRKLNGG